MFRALAASVIVASVLVWLALSAPGGHQRAAHRGAPATHAVHSAGLPLVFEANGGRTNPQARFIARGGGYTLFITPRESVMSLGRGGAVVRTRLVGARPGRVEGLDKLAGKVNYLVGPRNRWRTGIPTFGRVAARGVYPGVDVVYHGRQGALEYDLELAPGVDPARIRLAVSGARKLRLAANGDLLIATKAGVLRQHRPVATQGGERVAATFVLDRSRVGFQLGKFDRTRPLVIDPQISYSSPYAAHNYEFGTSVAVDGSGSPYIAGTTNSPDFPTQGSIRPISGEDAFVMKLTPDGASQIYSTYVGGQNDDEGQGIAVDPSGHAYVTGLGLGGYPAGATLIGPRGALDGWVAKLNPQGSGYDYFAVVGGSADEVPGGIAIDDSGQAYVGGYTKSSDFPGTGFLQYQEDAMVFKLNAAGTATVYSRYISGTNNDRIYGIDVLNGEAYVAGGSDSSDLPVTGAGQDYQPGDGHDGFVAKLGTTGSLVYLGYVGGQDQQGGLPANDGFVYDYLNDIAVAPDGTAWVIGYTESSSQPTSPGFSGCVNGHDDLLIAKISVTGGVWDAGCIGGSNGEGSAELGSVGDVATDAQGNGYFTSDTTSTNFPTFHAANLQTTGFGNDAVVFKLMETLSGPVKVFSTYLGGENGGDSAYGIAANPLDGSVWVVGATGSSDFPRVGSTRGTVPGSTDAFVTKYGIEPVAITEGPADGASVANRTPSFTFASLEPGAGYQCRTDSNAFAACSSPFSTSSLGDGQHTFDVRPLDMAATPGPVTSRTFTVDLSPKANLKIAPNPMLAGRAATLDASGSTDNDPIARFEWDVDGNGTFELDTGTTPTTTQTYVTPGTVHVSVRVTDPDGLTSTASADLIVNALPSGAKPFGVSINNGAQFTNDPDVKLVANFPPTTTSILASNDGGFGNAKTFKPQASIAWRLDSSGPERLPKTVYVRFLPSAVAGLTFQDDIILDETPPKIQSASLAGAAASGADASASKLPKWKLRIKATDKTSGVGRVQATTNKRKPGKLLKYKRKLTVKSAKRPRFVRVRDRAGNYSRWRKLS